jgi:SAM-dependent methyltransferase
MAQDSSRPDFWDVRFRGGVTPWDAGGVPPAFERWLAEQPGRLRVLVPGCGSAHEVRLLHERGHEVVAIDFSEAALEAAARALGPLATLARKADFFAFAEERPPFDLVYERAFLCALPRRVWPAWGKRVAQLVRPGGRLAGFFYLGENERGPPFGIEARSLAALLEPAFALEAECEVPPAQSIAVFRGKERWMTWRRAPL